VAKASSRKASTSRKKSSGSVARKPTSTKKTANKRSARSSPKKSATRTAAKTTPKSASRATSRARTATPAPPRREPQTHPEAAPLDAAVPQLKPARRPGKRIRNQAGLSTRELQHYCDLLLEKRRELVGDMSAMEREALRSSSGTNLSNLPLHMADMGTDNYEQEFTLGLVEKDRQLLREINHALAKIQDGTYGICEATGKSISKPRLEAQPWARYSIEYARQMERNRFRM
jgi:DnaK suppressor protein